MICLRREVFSYWLFGYLLLLHCHNLPCTEASCPPSSKTHPQCPEGVYGWNNVSWKCKCPESVGIPVKCWVFPPTILWLNKYLSNLKSRLVLSGSAAHQFPGAEDALEAVDVVDVLLCSPHLRLEMSIPGEKMWMLLTTELFSFFL